MLSPKQLRERQFADLTAARERRDGRMRKTRAQLEAIAAVTARLKPSPGPEWRDGMSPAETLVWWQSVQKRELLAARRGRSAGFLIIDDLVAP